MSCIKFWVVKVSLLVISVVFCILGLFVCLFVWLRVVLSIVSGVLSLWIIWLRSCFLCSCLVLICISRWLMVVSRWCILFLCLGSGRVVRLWLGLMWLVRLVVLFSFVSICCFIS